jgi:hypothetical protein
MPTIDNPTVRAYDDPLHINTIYFSELPFRADNASITQYC